MEAEVPVEAIEQPVEDTFIESETSTLKARLAPELFSAEAMEARARRRTLVHQVQQKAAALQLLVHQNNVRLGFAEAALDSQTAPEVDEEDIAERAEEAEAEGQAAEVEDEDEWGCELLDLTEDVLQLILAHLDVPSLCSAMQVCTTLRDLLKEEAVKQDLWRKLCKSEFNIDTDPTTVPCFESEDLGILNYFEDEVYTEMDERYGEWYDMRNTLHEAIWDGGAAGGGGFEAVFRDRWIGWTKIQQQLKLLKAKGFPEGWTGRRSSFELFTAMKYADLVTRDVGDPTLKKAALVSRAAHLAFSSLLDNGSTSIQELAASALANLLHNSPDFAATLALAGGHHALYRKLTSACAGVWRESTRGLVSMWAPGGVPHVEPGAFYGVESPGLPSGQWRAMEWSFTGQTQLELRTVQTYQFECEIIYDRRTGALSGLGVDDTDSFRLHGWLYGTGQGEATMQTAVNLSAWGSNSEMSEDLARHLAADMYEASCAATAASASGDAAAAPTIAGHQLCRIFRKYDSGAGMIYRGFKDKYGVWGVGQMINSSHSLPRVFRMWFVYE